jgi:hypothetical protein
VGCARFADASRAGRVELLRRCSSVNLGDAIRCARTAIARVFDASRALREQRMRARSVRRATRRDRSAPRDRIRPRAKKLLTVKRVGFSFRAT